jgi:hypothetical protein
LSGKELLHQTLTTNNCSKCDNNEKREEKLFGTKQNKKKTKKLLREEVNMVARND